MEFDFFEDDFLHMIWHQGAKPITLEEGKKKVDEFRRVFDGFITKEMKMPVVIDPRGWVDAGNSENDIHARIGEYLIVYGFDNSHGPDRPIIPHFYVFWNFPGMKRPPSKKLNDPVRPPTGYEWYSLDPKVDTPAPGVKIELAQAVGTKPKDARRISEKTGETKSDDPIRVNRSIMWTWIVGLFVLLFGAVVWLARKWVKNEWRVIKPARSKFIADYQLVARHAPNEVDLNYAPFVSVPNGA
jgi:hypothetical protein